MFSSRSGFVALDYMYSHASLRHELAGTILALIPLIILKTVEIIEISEGRIIVVLITTLRLLLLLYGGCW